MQNKGAIIFFAVALSLVSIYQLSFTGATYKVKRDAREYAKGDLNKESAYLDSIAALPKETWSFLGSTFKECQRKEINLGLDLKGGMNVTMEISVEDIVKALSNYNPDKNFNAALVTARERQKGSQGDFIELFGKAYEELDPNAKLAAIFGTIELKDKINFNSTNADVIKVLQEETTAAIDNAFNILRTRIDRFGVVQPNISQASVKGRILIELPGVKDPKRVRELLQGTANLEFWETYENSEIIPYLSAINTLLRDIQVADAKLKATTSTTTTTATSAKPDTTTAGDQSLLNLLQTDTTTTAAADQTLEQFTVENPLFGILIPRVTQAGEALPSSMVGLASFKDTAKVNSYLKLPQVKSILPRDLKLFWSQAPYKYDETGVMYELHAIKVTTRDGRAPLDGSVITGARPSSGATTSEITVDMTMSSDGAKTWARMTRDNIGRSIAVVLDGYVRSYPTVQTEITGGSTQISGDFTIEEADDLANILKSGTLPAPARIVSDNVVGPTLGKEAIQSGFISFVIAFVLILVYMIFYYSKSAGSIADIALFANVFLPFWSTGVAWCCTNPAWNRGYSPNPGYGSRCKRSYL